jgi:hypothetical protein
MSAPLTIGVDERHVRRGAGDPLCGFRMRVVGGDHANPLVVSEQASQAFPVEPYKMR